MGKDSDKQNYYSGKECGNGDRQLESKVACEEIRATGRTFGGYI